MSEHKRGVAGNMPGAHLTDVLVPIWQRLEAGDEEGARTMHNALAVLENAVRGMPVDQVHREIRVRRGVISSVVCRDSVPVSLDTVDRAELDYALSQVEPFFTL